MRRGRGSAAMSMNGIGEVLVHAQYRHARQRKACCMGREGVMPVCSFTQYQARL